MLTQCIAFDVITAITITATNHQAPGSPLIHYLHASMWEWWPYIDGISCTEEPTTANLISNHK